MKTKSLILLTVFLLGSFAVAQEEGTPTLPSFGEMIEVHLVPLHVLVRDRKGNPVSGLTREDFILLEDGVEKQITHFAEVKERVNVNVFTASIDDPNAVKNESSITPSTEKLLGERYIFYIDNINIHPLQRNSVIKKTVEFVKERIGNGIQGMVVTFDRSLHIHTPFTDDAQLLINKLEEQKMRTGEALQRLSERRSLIDGFKNDEHRRFSSDISKARRYAAQIHNDMMFTLDALKDFLIAIRGMEGRNVLVYVSNGLPETPAYEVFYYLAGIYPHENVFSYADLYNLHSHYRSIVNFANSASVNLCMIDVAGLRALGTEGIAEERYAGLDMDYTIETNNLIDPLKMMAEETGGVAIVNTNDFVKGFKRIADIVDNYYFLGYQRARPIEDRFHKIKVKLKEKIKGSRISYKKSFLEKSTHSLMGDKIIANLIFPSRENPHNFKITFEQPRVNENDEETFVLPMALKIPFKSLNMIVQNERYIGRILIGFAAGDGRDRTEVVWKSHDFNIPEAAMEELNDKDFNYTLELLIRSGGNIVSVGILNELDSIESYERERVFIKPPQ